MTNNDNSVNIESGRGRYHHGDLRQAVVLEGLRLLAVRSADDISLREIARNVGVSATAVYRHFPDKQALLVALAMEGGERMAKASQEAVALAGTGIGALDALGVAYVAFALENPALFRLMMANIRLGVDRDDSSEGLWKLFDIIDKVAPFDISPEARRVLIVRAWGLVHGLAMLMLDGHVPSDMALVRRVICQSTETHQNQ